MFKFLRKKKKGQSTLEYAVLIIIVIGALLSIQTYIKRGVQGRLKSASDDIGDQYSPGNTNLIKTVVTKSVTQELFDTGESTSTLLEDEVTNTYSNSKIINTEREFWGNS